MHAKRVCNRGRLCQSSICNTFIPTPFFFLLLQYFILHTSVVSSLNYAMPGDINLGGIIPLHTYNEMTQSCGAIRSINSLKKVEAMVYAVQQVNQNTTLLPNITLGFEIYDTCSYDSITLRESLNFIPPTEQPENECRPSSVAQRHQPVVGVVGAQRSSSSLQAAILFGLYNIPQVSYLSTSDELSNNRRYPYFLRTVGPDRYQVKAIIDILLHYHWSYVSFISSEDVYGKNAEQYFLSQTAQKGICIGLTLRVPAGFTDDKYDTMIKQLLDFQNGSNATVVILFLHLEMAQGIFSAATRGNVTRRFIWIGSDGWGNYGEQATMGNEEAAVGSFTIVPESNILPGFNEYFRSLTPTTSNNPWLTEFLQHYTGCTTEDQSTYPSCNDPGVIRNLDSDESSHESLVVDSVLAFAYALEVMRGDLCPNGTTGLCSEMESIDGDDLLKYLLETKFVSPANGHVSFLPNGDVLGRYSIRYLQKVDDNNYAFEQVGQWSEERNADTVMRKTVSWYLHGRGSEVPKSICSEACKEGERVIVDVDNPCCWTCSPCYPHEIVINENTECASCIDTSSRIFSWPNENSTECVEIEPSANDWGPILVTVSSIGILVTIGIICLYTYKLQNALIKASGREMSYIMLVGIFLAYFSALLYGVYPTNGVCYLLRLVPGVATSFIYVSLAAKTIRLFRIFRASVKSAKRPKFIRPKSQIILTLFITSIPVLWTVIWIIVDSPMVVTQLPENNQNYLEVTCTQRDAWVIGLMVWNMSAVLVCSVLAFLTRELPENYNESKFITFCAFCSLVVFLAFSSTYLTVEKENAYYRAGYSSLGLIVNATVTLLCLFVAKLYAIYFVKFEEWGVNRRRSSLPSWKASSKGVDNADFSPEIPATANGRASDLQIHSTNNHSSHNDGNNQNISRVDVAREATDMVHRPTKRPSDNCDIHSRTDEISPGQEAPDVSNDSNKIHSIHGAREIAYHKENSTLSVNSVQDLPDGISVSLTESV